MKNKRKLKRNKNIYREFPPNVMDLGGYISPYEEIGLNTDNAAKPKNTYMTAGQEVGWAALDILASPVGISGKPLSGYLTNKRSSVTGSKGSTFGTIESQYMHPVAQEVMKAFPVTKPFAEAGQAIGDMVSPMVNADDPNAVANRQMMRGIGGAVSQAGQSINNSAQNWGAGKQSFNLGGQLPMNMNLNELNGPSHEEGGMSISPQVEVEGNETIFEPESYVFSDSLTVPGKKRTFAQESKSIRKKYDLRPEDKLSQNAMNKELESLMISQEKVKQLQMIKDYERFNKRMMLKYGGPLTKGKDKNKDKNKDNSFEPLDIKWHGGTEDISDIKPLANTDYKQDEFFKANMNDPESILAHIGSSYPSDISVEIVNWYNDTYAKPNASKGVRSLWADVFPDGSTTYGYQGIDMNKYRDNPNMAKKYGLIPSKFNEGGGLFTGTPEDPYKGISVNNSGYEYDDIPVLNDNLLPNPPVKTVTLPMVPVQPLNEPSYSNKTEFRGEVPEVPIIPPVKKPKDSKPRRSDYNNLANNIAMATAGAKGLNKQRLLLTPRLKMNYLNSRAAEILAENQASQSMAAGLDTLKSSGASAAQVLGGAAQLVNNINRTAAGTVADLRLKRDMQNTEIANQLAANNQGVARENNALTTQYDAAQMLRRDKILDDFSRIGQSRVIDDKQRNRELNILESLGKENYMYDKNGRAMVKLDGKNWVYLSDALKKLNN